MAKHNALGDLGLLRGGSKNGLSRRHLEGKSTPIRGGTDFACALSKLASAM